MICKFRWDKCSQHGGVNTSEGGVYITCQYLYLSRAEVMKCKSELFLLAAFLWQGQKKSSPLFSDPALSEGRGEET